MARNGSLSVLTQGTAEELGQSIGLLLDTRPGERLAFPDYGLPQPLGAGADVDQIVDVVNTWEERATQVAPELLTQLVDQAVDVHATNGGDA